ncbi:hypothetical protein BDW22DRAFT_1353701 [Trametopsis cervina]|nr:hypothetical protein BDW22DRAFT_1353701 [Trametopsis cervina]
MSSNTELLSIGHQCSHPSCHLVDFLPFKCQHCASPFCASHFRPQAHACEKYDEHAVDRVAPSCPLCNTPVAIPPGEDPNVRMDRHISSECSITTGKTKTSSTPHCAQPRCGKLLFAPIQCSTCKHQYCPAHRFPKDHTCSPPPVLPTSATGKKQPSAASAAALAAFRRTVQPKGKGASPATSAAAAAKPKAKPAAVPVKAAASSSTPTQTPASTAGKGGSKPSAFSKTDR